MAVHCVLPLIEGMRGLVELGNVLDKVFHNFGFGVFSAFESHLVLKQIAVAFDGVIAW